jgi:DNA-binding transcriptional LysR family regulator
LVREYHRRFPDVELTLLELTNAQQLEAFDHGELDIGFCRPLPAERSREFHEELVYTDYLHLVLPSGHPLARNLTRDGTLHIKRLSAERFVLLQRQASQQLYDEKLAFCRRVGNFSPQVVNEPDRTSTVLLLVESGIGVSLVAGRVRRNLPSRLENSLVFHVGCNPLARKEWQETRADTPAHRVSLGARHRSAGRLFPRKVPNKGARDLLYF